MFSTPASDLQDRHRPLHSPSLSHSSMHQSPFSVAGMSSSASGHGHGPTAWTSPTAGGSLSTSLGDTFTPSKTHYQSGYMMMSAAHSNNSPPNNQRLEEVPVVQTKAKMNHVLASDFGMESMFENSRKQRQTLTDEDAPPTTSVNDIPTYAESSPVSFGRRSSVLDHSSSLSMSARPARPPPTPQSSQILYIIVFGYPPDKYSVTVEYFKSLGDTTEPDQNMEIINCFRIGYRDPASSLRAVRKNGEILGGSWMIGAKWADPAQAEALLGYPVARGAAFSGVNSPEKPSNSMAIDEPSSSIQSQLGVTPTVGTPIKLAPSTSAFRKSGSGRKMTVSHDGHRGQEGHTPVGGGNTSGGLSMGTSPQKGMLGQVSDLIFGW